jgi:hypothetical protein
MKNHFSGYLSVVIKATLLIFMTYIGVIIYLDPLQIFHKAPFSEGYFYQDQATHNAGIINNYNFNSIIIGTSMLENTSSIEAGRLLNSSFVNLSIGGSKLADRALILERTLGISTLSIKNIILSLDGFDRIGNYREMRPMSLYSYLYDDVYFNDIKIYFNLKYILVAGCQIVRKNIEYCSDLLRDVDNLNEWYSDKSQSDRFGGIDNWIDLGSGQQVKEALNEIVEVSKCVRENNCKLSGNRYQHFEESFNEYILKFSKSNPGVNFHLIFPPYSRLKYAIWSKANPKEFKSYLQAIKYIVLKSEHFQNTIVYGFDNLEFVDDISNYKDTTHYHPDINSMMLYSIRDKKNILNSDNIDSYIKKITQQAQVYDISVIADKIQDKLKL